MILFQQPTLANLQPKSNLHIDCLYFMNSCKGGTMLEAMHLEASASRIHSHWNRRKHLAPEPHDPARTSWQATWKKQRPCTTVQ